MKTNFLPKIGSRPKKGQLAKGSAALLLFLFTICGTAAFAQTPGIIFKPATAVGGVNPLDPNQDGYTSPGTAGFTGGDTGSDSEIPYIALPQISLEPTGDLGPGPACKFTDIVDNGQERGVSYYVDNNSNYLFRFRLGGSAPNAKGYSILIDADQRFGTSGANADLNAVPGNPGFEIEVLLTTGGSSPGVNVYNVNGRSYSGTTANEPIAVTNTVTQFGLSTHFQKSVALTANCGDLDVFYDFYIPVSILQSAYSGFSTSTPIRMVANTVIAPLPALRINQISDLNGAGPLSAYGGNIENAWQALINNYPPTSPTGNPSIQDRSQPPVITGPLVANPTAASTVTGTSSEANGTTITVYKNGTVIGTTTVSGGSWTLSVAAGVLTTGANFTATALAPGELLSDFSNSVTVGGSTCTGLPSQSAVNINCNNDKGISGTIGSTGNFVSGATVRLYQITATGISPTPITASSPSPFPANTSTASYVQNVTNTAGLFYFSCSNYDANCNSAGGNNCAIGNYLLTVQEPGKCESGYKTINTTSSNGTVTVSSTYCNGLSGVSNAPTLTVPTGGFTTSTTSITGNISPVASPTTIYILADGAVIGTTTVTGTAATSFTISNLRLEAGNQISAFAISANRCASNFSTPTNVGATAPRILSPIYTNSTTITGTSNEAPGTIITVYSSATTPTTTSPGTALGTTTVGANGNWSLAISGSLTANNIITAAVTNISGAIVSPLSNQVGVGTPVTVVPSVSGPITEGQTSVSGTVPAGYPTGSIIYVYEDDFLIGTASITGTTWTLTGLSTTEGNEKYLYAGGEIKAAVGPNTTNGENYIGAKSAGVIVGCPTIAISNPVSANPATICSNASSDIVIGSSVLGYIYTLQNNTSGATIGTSRSGTGANLTIPTGPLSTTTTIRVSALKIGATICPGTLTNTTTVTVNAFPTLTNAVTAITPICTGSPVNITVANSQTGFTYQLRNGTTNIGSAIAGNGGNLVLPAGNIAYNSNITYNVLVYNTNLNTCSGQLNQTVTVREDCPAVYTVAALQNRDAYITNFTAATVTDPDGAISNAVLVNGTTLPAGFALNATTGAVTVSDASLVPASGTFTFQIRTTDVNGGQTTHTVTLTIIADQEAAYTVTPRNQDVPVNTVLASATDANGAITSATLVSGSLPAGTVLNANGSITVQNQFQMQPGTYPVEITTVDATGGRTTQTITIFVTGDLEAVYTSTPRNQDAPAGTVLASITDANGSITSATINSGTLPAGVDFNTTSGAFTVQTAGALVPGTYTLNVTTIDNTGGVTTQNVTLTILADQEAVYTTAPVHENAPAGTVLASVSDNNGNIVSATLTNGSLPAGTTLSANGTISVQTQNEMAPGSYPVTIVTTDAQGGVTTSTLTLVVNADQEATYTVSAAANWYDNFNGKVLANLTDADGAITAVSVASSTFPQDAVTVNPVTGQIVVLQQALLRPGVTYTVEVTTTDIRGGVSTVTVSFTFTGDRDGDGVDDFADQDNNNDGITNFASDASGTVFINNIPYAITVNALGDDDADGLLNYADADYVHPVFGNWRDKNTDGINDWFDIDLDGIINLFDLDIDGDGILNTIEGNGGTAPAASTSFDITYGRYMGPVNAAGIPLGSLDSNGNSLLPLPNTDGDFSASIPLPDFRDTDSDNDGLTDNYEAQATVTFIPHSPTDANRNGISDAYDPLQGGTALVPINSDANALFPYVADLLPDYLDTNSDGDEYADSNEGFDNNNNGRALDDLMARAAQFVTAGGNPNYYNNALDSNNDGVPNWLADNDNDGIRNYLDEGSPYYFDTDLDGLIDLFDTDNFGTPASPPDNNSNGIPDFRDNGITTPLPVELLSFTAKPVGLEVLVNWTTVMEKDNAYFEVQRSANGQQFTTIGTVEGFGNSDYRIDYAFTDSEPLTGLTYYRLRQVDLDGTATLSQMVTVRMAAPESLSLTAYPNPFHDKVNLEVNAPAEEQMTLRVTDMQGKALITRKVPVNKGRNLLQYQFDTLPAGTYIISLTGTQEQAIRKLVKE